MGYTTTRKFLSNNASILPVLFQLEGPDSNLAILSGIKGEQEFDVVYYYNIHGMHVSLPMFPLIELLVGQNKESGLPCLSVTVSTIYHFTTGAALVQLQH